jgi:Cys-rich protein (TIGR01571 family)
VDTNAEALRQYSVFSTLSSLCALILTVVSVLLVTIVRGKIRRRFQIPGDDCNDFCCSFWCQCCVLAQVRLGCGQPPQDLCESESESGLHSH